MFEGETFWTMMPLFIGVGIAFIFFVLTIFQVWSVHNFNPAKGHEKREAYWMQAVEAHIKDMKASGYNKKEAKIGAESFYDGLIMGQVTP